MFYLLFQIFLRASKAQPAVDEHPNLDHGRILEAAVLQHLYMCLYRGACDIPGKD